MKSIFCLLYIYIYIYIYIDLKTIFSFFYLHLNLYYFILQSQKIIKKLLMFYSLMLWLLIFYAFIKTSMKY